jgi:diacylglycerol diphosphate phosphatase/phosphatidate phosphatase
MGLGYALSTSTLVVDIIKVTVGGLRPHFWVVCDPILIAHSPGPPMSPPIYATADLVCANEDPCALKEAMMSFPSGHSCAAFAGFGFLGLWLFGHIKHTAGPVAHWKIIVWVTPWVVAGLLAWSKVLDGWHHPGDVVAGALLGASFATIAYKAVYGSILDPATNHVAR